MNIGKIVRFHRQQAGFTQLELAEHAGVGKSTIFDIEKGKQSVSLQKVSLVLKVLNIQLQWQSPLKALYIETEGNDA